MASVVVRKGKGKASEAPGSGKPMGSKDRQAAESEAAVDVDVGGLPGANSRAGGGSRAGGDARSRAMDVEPSPMALEPSGASERTGRALGSMTTAGKRRRDGEPSGKDAGEEGKRRGKRSRHLGSTEGSWAGRPESTTVGRSSLGLTGSSAGISRAGSGSGSGASGPRYETEEVSMPSMTERFGRMSVKPEEVDDDRVPDETSLAVEGHEGTEHSVYGMGVICRRPILEELFRIEKMIVDSPEMLAMFARTIAIFKNLDEYAIKRV